MARRSLQALRPGPLARDGASVALAPRSPGASALWCSGCAATISDGTLAFGIIVHVGLVEFRALTGGQDGLSGIPPLSLSGCRCLPTGRSFRWRDHCIAVMLLAENLVKSPAGLAMRAVAENEAVAGSLGIASDRLKRRIMAVSGFYAALGGAVYAHYLGYIIRPLRCGFSIRLLLMVALGGFAGIWSVLFGVVFVIATASCSSRSQLRDRHLRVCWWWSWLPAARAARRRGDAVGAVVQKARKTGDQAARVHVSDVSEALLEVREVSVRFAAAGAGGRFARRATRRNPRADRAERRRQVYSAQCRLRPSRPIPAR